MKLRLFAFVLEGAAILSAGSERMLTVPMSFEPNAGQAPADVSYLGRNGEGAVLLKSNEVVFLGPQGSVGMRFPGASARVRMDATKEVPGVSHYFVGSTTIPDVRHYASVTYRDLYRGISLVLRGKPAEIEYDFVVAPGANPARIRLTFEGIESAALTAGGDLVLRTPDGEWRHKRPSAFQEMEGKRRRVEVDYLLIGNKQIAFRVGRYDRRASLVIDPVVVYTSTPAPGGIHGLATDAVGNIYATGFLPGSGVCGSYSFFGRTSPIPCNHAFVAKLDPTGTRLLYNTMLAGMSEDRGISIAVDNAGNAYILGNTYSPDFPVSASAAQTKFAGPTGPIAQATAGGDLFVAKVDPFGRLIYSTFLGGQGNEYAGRIRIDSAGNAYISGMSYSSDFPTTAGVHLKSSATGGPVVAKLNPPGTQVLWSTYVDLQGGDSAPAVIDIDIAGAVYMASASAVVKIAVDGRSLIYRSVVGQTVGVAHDVAVDSQGRAWVVGHKVTGGGFISKISPDGSTLVFAVDFGQGISSYNVATRIALDAVDRAYICGVWSQLPVTADALISNPPDPYAPGFLSVFNPDGSVAYASYVPKQIGPLTVDSSGQVYTADGSSVTKTDLQLPYVASVLNSASLQDSGQVAPGELITLRGLGLGPRGGVSSQLDANGYVATSLGGTRVMFGGAPTSVLYASDQRVDTVVPFGAQPGSIVQVRVEANGQSSPPLPIKIAAADPAVFALFRGGRGQAAALNQDGTLNSPQNPAPRGSIITLFATGGGSFDPPLADGQITPVPGPALQLPVQVFFHGTPSEVVSASGAPGLVAGVIQINARVPADLPPRLNLDAVDINLSIGTITSRAAISIAVR